MLRVSRSLRALHAECGPAVNTMRPRVPILSPTAGRKTFHQNGPSRSLAEKRFYVAASLPRSAAYDEDIDDYIDESPCLVQHPAPDFSADVVYKNGRIENFTLSDLQGKKYVMLLFYPLDFTFVCPTEIIAFNKALPEFKKRDCEVFGVSVDSQFTHNAWMNTPRDKGGLGGDVDLPLISDITKEISSKYKVLLKSGVSLRGLFLIDKEGIVQHMLVNSAPIGRSTDEALRILDALQFTEKEGEVCPANWKKNKKGMKATNAGVAEYLTSPDMEGNQ